MYSLGHDAVRQFLTEDKAWHSRLTAADRRLAELAVRRFGNDWSAVDPFDPVESYLLFHLLDHATAPKLRERLLADTALADACMKHGIVLSNKREFAAALLACDLAVNLREDQVHRQGRRGVPIRVGEGVQEPLLRAVQATVGRREKAVGPHCEAAVQPV